MAADPTGCSSCTGVPVASAEFDARTFGAVGDGKTIDTGAIQKAIGAAFAAGGGLVVLQGGQFLTGRISLQSRVYLDVRPDAVLKGSWDPADYPVKSNEWVVVSAVGATSTGIVGGGVLDGQALPGFLLSYVRSEDQLQPVRWTEPSFNCTGECRPRLVEFEQCDDVLVRDVTLQNSADWTSRYFNSTNVLVHNITVHGDLRWPNNDGIDPDSSENVTISNSTVHTGDDGVCLKSTCGARPLRNVLVQGMEIRSRSAAVKLGSSTCADMADILVREVRVLAGSNRGIGVQHRDAGNITNLEFRDIVVEGTELQPSKWWGIGEALWVTSIPREEGRPVGRIDGVRFVRVTSAGAVNGALFSSRTATPLAGLRLVNVSLTLVGPARPRMGVAYSQIARDYRPEPSGVPGVVPWVPPGAYLEHATGAVFDGVTLTSRSDLPRLPGAPAPAFGPCINGTTDSLQSLERHRVVCSVQVQ